MLDKIALAFAMAWFGLSIVAKMSVQNEIAFWAALAIGNVWVAACFILGAIYND